MKNSLWILFLTVATFTTPQFMHALTSESIDPNSLQHFYVNTNNLEGNWELVKVQKQRNGALYKIYERTDLREGIEKERIVVMAAPTSQRKKDMRSLMRKALFPVKYAPGTKTKVHRETDSEAIMEWWSADQYHSFVRIMTTPNEYHSVTYLYKGKHKPTQEEKDNWVAYLDRIQLNY